MTDENIDFSNCQNLDEVFFENALLSGPNGTYHHAQGYLLFTEDGIVLLAF